MAGCEDGRGELHLGDTVAIADGSEWQGERGRVVALEGDAVVVEVRVPVLSSVRRRVVGHVVRRVLVAWWKDVQVLSGEVER